jgi:hypothetical protein
MIQWVAAIFLVFGFLFLAQRFELVKKSKEALSVAQGSFTTIRNPGISDDIKEAMLRRDARHLFWLSLTLSLGAAAAVALPIGLLWLCGKVGLVSFSSILKVTCSPAFIIGIGILSIFLYLGSNDSSGADGYPALSRIMHRLVFKTSAAQISLADIEDKIYSKPLALCKIDRPVFITALPRAGTTLLLRCCAGLQEFASHCYRDMPFVLIPCLWNSFSSAFQKSGKPQERAHGDGMLIDFDSPEALEEVIWKAFWQGHYRKDRIIPWQDEDNIEFEEFFRSHMRKIIFLRRGNNISIARYISKNNLNIARIAMLRRLFPDSIIIVPFRQPLRQSASLLKQHINFLRIHKENPFASEYMRAIGHYDFGENLCPVDFAGWFEKRNSKDSRSLAFWLEYWIAAYKYLLAKNAGCFYFLSFDDFCNNPETGLRLFANMIRAKNPDALISQASSICRPKLQEADITGVPEALIHEADYIYAKLRDASIRGAGI